jgi:prepilin-type N-terminal cleavage/methylation domain-containing protein
MKRLRGFTLIEFLVVVILIGTLGTVLLDRLLAYQEAAEKAEMEQAVGVLRSALHMQLADRLVKGGVRAVPGLRADNPMDWLAQAPPNYVGVRFAPKPGEVPRGSWYFDLSDQQLVYVPRRAEHLAPNAAGRCEVRYRVALVYEKSTQEQAISAENKEVQGVIQTLAEPYRWF